MSTAPSSGTGPAALARPTAAKAAAPRRALRPRRASSTRVVVTQVLIAAVFLGLWQVASNAHWINPLIFSSPWDIVQRLASYLAGESVYSRTIYDHLRVTLEEMAFGYVGGAVLGLALGFFLARSDFFSRVFEPFVLAVYSIPKIALAPLIILILGIGVQSKIGVVVMETFFLVFFNTFAGVRGVSEEYIQLARIMGASSSQVTRRIILPAALPSIMIGLKMGVPYAMIGAIIGEFIASTEGLGWLILYTSSNFDPAGLFAALALLVAVVWILGRILAWAESRLLRWRPSAAQEVVQF